MLSEVKYGKHIQGEIIDFTMLECGGCGIPFFVPTKWKNNKVSTHGSFNCPNGCDRQFCGETKEEKLQRELEQVKQQRLREQEELQNKWLDEMGRANKLEKQLKKVHKGTCPCCKRSFENLKRHMETKHPELAPKLIVAPIHQSINARGKKKI
jgi:hypothetical protein